MLFVYQISTPHVEASIPCVAKSNIQVEPLSAFKTCIHTYVALYSLFSSPLIAIMHFTTVFQYCRCWVLFQRKWGLWFLSGNTFQGQSWWLEADKNLTCDLRHGYEYELAESRALAQVQGPDSGANNGTDLGLFKGILQLPLKIWVGSEWLHSSFPWSSLLTSRVLSWTLNFLLYLVSA